MINNVLGKKNALWRLFHPIVLGQGLVSHKSFRLFLSHLFNQLWRRQSPNTEDACWNFKVDSRQISKPVHSGWFYVYRGWLIYNFECIFRYSTVLVSKKTCILKTVHYEVIKNSKKRHKIMIKSHKFSRYM